MSEKTKKVNVPGFLANGISVGIKDSEKKDLGLIFSNIPAKVAAVFTKNSFKAAPLLINTERVKRGIVQAIITNSGCANAATGKEGYKDALNVSAELSKQLKIKEDLILLGSTGVIGKRLPVKKINSGIGKLVKGLNEFGIEDAQAAMMTTDKFPKIAIRKGIVGAKDITICGIAKGAGMIEPNMATLLTYIMTDALIDNKALNTVFHQAIDATFNCISVDGCMSTNDMAVILANGLAGNNPLERAQARLQRFRDMLCDVLLELCQAVIRDGEGATKFITISVEGAKSRSDARRAAYAVANSNLVKTAFFGQDPNWGRIIAALGSSGIPMERERVTVSIGGILVFAQDSSTNFNLHKLKDIFQKKEIEVRIALGGGDKSYYLYTSDLSHDYIKINAEYAT
ncbi:MAG: bifunctional glutamate N-acetyltransferase/amino-acid acetyltransferase ArgJ [Smithellaceae bacterium]|mgnify:FL=1|jgi:glutamate N-acetyltransferase/amino-acid N-acetyltransferase|nr:bifunctional glutamate N-acetyltransferase/amino-acid acetyltransferase ArgJ [Syntrophaceae bacterium]NMD04471.1 bifunctional glutamate N-acetyltransferase/amino-acid acetyltransferase ArgJ [Deltaproteobacteria bacterium]HNZ30761.1 bifunctional glutamate N-acetyltransferase/amino-acid acetyltransferase ArgJ [Smithellaceae bacterium]MBP8607951.1 bifunctional glutamate N-acetyltransferase/amino-acid acetyltransferase ArgJ [Syntrophaceae bacterium]HOM68730.1 bifunctional glutamate N-acetyltrans